MGQALAQSIEESIAAYRSHFGIGGVSVQLAGRRSTDVTLVPSLEPFRIETLVSDINIRVERVDRLSPPVGRQIFDSGTTWELHGGETEFQFDFNAAMFGDRPFKRLLVDRKFQRATLQMNGDCLAGFPSTVEPLGYPLDELLIMHRLTQEQAIELHGVGIVGPNGLNNLFVGHSGAGKSTTARLWTSLHAVKILSDDRIIVREDNMPDQETQIFMYGTPWHGEAHFALPQRAPLHRICILEHGQGNILTRLSRSQAVAELFARSFVPFHHHEYVDSALSFLERLVGTIPCYRFSFEPDERAVERIFNFRD
jgi:hypothetical protein